LAAMAPARLFREGKLELLFLVADEAGSRAAAAAATARLTAGVPVHNSETPLCA
jgi:hypothetical protein